MLPFRPTHVIWWTPARPGLGNTRSRSVRVMLTGEGSAYTRAEWDAGEHADWTYSKADGWRCLGQATPNSETGTVTVRRITKKRR